MDTILPKLMVQQSYASLNVRDQYDGIRKKKDSLLPYTDENDVRFAWLYEELLLYLQNWESSIINREDSFLKKDRSKMFLSYQMFDRIADHCSLCNRNS